jgi:hypothetical protein
VFGCERKVPIVSKVKKLWEYWLCCHLLQSAALCWLCQCPFYDICLTNLVVWKKGRRWDHLHNLFDKFGCGERRKKMRSLTQFVWQMWLCERRKKMRSLTQFVWQIWLCERKKKMMRSLTQFVWQIWLWIWLWEKEDDEITHTICLTNLVVKERKMMRSHTHSGVSVLFPNFSKTLQLLTYLPMCTLLSFPLLYLWTSQYPPPVHPNQWRMNEWMNEW